jgi:hypothetical protein
VRPDAPSPSLPPSLPPSISLSLSLSLSLPLSLLGILELEELGVTVKGMEGRGGGVQARGGWGGMGMKSYVSVAEGKGGCRDSCVCVCVRERERERSLR